MRGMKELGTLQTVLKELCDGNPLAWTKFHDITSDGLCPETLKNAGLTEILKITKKMKELAFDYLTQESDKKGNLFASAVLGHMYKYAEFYHISKNRKNADKGFELIKKAADANNMLGIYLLASHYVQSEPKDYPKAIECYQKGAAQGWPDSLVGLGYRYKLGQGVEKDLNTARRYFLEAAKLGCPSALNEVTRQGDDLGNPFIFFTPKNLAFTYQVVPNKGKTVYLGNVEYVNDSVDVTVTYTGDVNLGKPFSVTKRIGPENTNWQGLCQAMGYHEGQLSTKTDFDAFNKLRAKIVQYYTCRSVSAVISEFDALLTEEIAKAKTQQAPAAVPRTSQSGANPNFSGAFFNPAGSSNSAVVPHQVQPIDPDQMLQIWQMLQQNPQFASQVAALHQQFLQAGVPNQLMPQPQYGVPAQQLPPSQFPYGSPYQNNSPYPRK